MNYFGDFSNKWLKVLVPLIKEIQRISEGNESAKEKVFQIKISLFGAAEDVKDISNIWIENNIFAASITNTPLNIQYLKLPNCDMDLNIHLN